MEVKEIYYNVSQSQLSVARFYGGATIGGVEYIYIPADDTLVLKSKKIKNSRKKTKTKVNQKKLDL